MKWVDERSSASALDKNAAGLRDQIVFLRDQLAASDKKLVHAMLENENLKITILNQQSDINALQLTIDNLKTVVESYQRQNQQPRKHVTEYDPYENL
jgi:chromosome segregation ATPase